MISRTLGASRCFFDVSKHAGELTEFAQALYPLLVVNSDDHGREAADAFTVKHAVWPTSPRTEVEFEVALAALHASHLIERYAVDGVIYLQILHFDEHQPGLNRRTASKFPEVPDNSGSPLKFTAVPETPGTTAKSTEIPSELKGTEQNRTQPNGTELRTEPRDGAGDEFWQRWRELFRQTQHGATVALQPRNRELDDVIFLVTAYPDLDYLATMAELFFRLGQNKRHELHGRVLSIGMFRHWASNLDSELRQSGRAPLAAVAS